MCTGTRSNTQFRCRPRWKWHCAADLFCCMITHSAPFKIVHVALSSIYHSYKCASFQDSSTLWFVTCQQFQWVIKNSIIFLLPAPSHNLHDIAWNMIHTVYTPHLQPAEFPILSLFTQAMFLHQLQVAYLQNQVCNLFCR